MVCEPMSASSLKSVLSPAGRGGFLRRGREAGSGDHAPAGCLLGLWSAPVSTPARPRGRRDNSFTATTGGVRVVWERMFHIPYGHLDLRRMNSFTRFVHVPAAARRGAAVVGRQQSS